MQLNYARFRLGNKCISSLEDQNYNSWFRPRSSDVQEEVVAACKAANAHEFILEMEEGYETRVGEKGRC